MFLLDTLKPIEIVYYPDNIHIKWIKYFDLSSKLHRENGPAHICYNENGTISRMDYYRNGVIHNDNGPAVVCYHNEGKLKLEQYVINGKTHREDGPAIIAYYEDETICQIQYWKNGQPHNDNGPSSVNYVNGKKVLEGYCKNGKFEKYIDYTN